MAYISGTIGYVSTTLFIVMVVVITALIFDFTNGFHDSSNAMATSVATGAFTPKRAVTVAAALNIIGAFISTEVAKTISHGMFDDRLIQAAPAMVFAGLAGAILWNLATWLFGLPSSSSHALFGGLIGAVIVAAGIQGVNWGVVVSKIILPAVVAPFVAGTASALATWVAYKIVPSDEEAYTNKIFKIAQRFSASMVAFSHGTSDGQKTMGVITLVLVAAGYQEAGTGPQWWVVVSAGLAIGLGFASELSSAVAILASSHLGFALSTTHICSGSVVGTGVGRGAKVETGTLRKMFIAWIITLPAAAVVGGLTSFVAVKGAIPGLFVVIIALILSSLMIVRHANQNKVDFANVNDANTVVVDK